MTIESSQLLDTAKNVLHQMGIYSYIDVKLTHVTKEVKEWKVGFSFRETSAWSDRVACFSVNFQSEEITGMWLDKVWKRK